MEQQEKVVGRETSPCKVITAQGHGQANVHKNKGPLRLGPRRQVKVVLDFRRRSRKDSGRQVKVPRACVNRPTQYRKLEAGMEITHR